MVLTRSLPQTTAAIPPTKLAHVVFRTRQLEPMVEWYSNVLGAHTVFENPRMAFLTYDDEHHRIAIIAGDIAERPAETSVGFYHVAFTYPGIGDLLSTYRRLKADGITPQRAIRHGVTVSFYYRDPDDNDVELQIDVFETLEEINGFLTGPAFARDPIGPLFDPEQMIADYEAGLPLEQFVRRADDHPR